MNLAQATPGLLIGIPTAVVLLSLLVVGLVLLILVRQWRRFVSRMQESDPFRTTAWIIEPLAAFAAGALGTGGEIYKAATWATPKPFLIVLVPVILGLLTASIGLKVMATWAKEKEKEKLSRLEAELAAAEERNAELTAARVRSVWISSYVRELVSEKLWRVREALDTPVFAVGHYLAALSSRDQLQLILRAIHRSFARQLDAGKHVRVAVYIREPSDSLYLVPGFSWDGRSADCMRKDNSEYMRLDAADGARSLVLQCYRSDATLQIVSNTEQARREGTFRFFRPEQAESLRSVVAYKHLWERSPGKGRLDALIVCVDTDQADFFGRFQEDELTEFFVEMMMRFEYEHACQEAEAKLRSNALPL